MHSVSIVQFPAQYHLVRLEVPECEGSERVFVGLFLNIPPQHPDLLNFLAFSFHILPVLRSSSRLFSQKTGFKAAFGQRSHYVSERSRHPEVNIIH